MRLRSRHREARGWRLPLFLGITSLGACSFAPIFAHTDAMKEHASNALEKLKRHLGEPLPELWSRAYAYTRESALAAIGLRACTAVGVGARCNGTPSVNNEGRLLLGDNVWLD